MKTAVGVESFYEELDCSDGSKMHVYVSRPKGLAKTTALLVFQEAFGVNAHIRDLTEQFAKIGFTAVAPEIYHRTAPPKYEGPYADFQSVMQHYAAVTQQTLRADLTATADWLKAQDSVDFEKLAAIGYCMGGKVAFFTNTVLPLKASISYYGGRMVPEYLPLTDALKAPMLFFWGGLDKHIPQEQIRSLLTAMDKSGKTYSNVEFSDADHAFACNDRPAYNARATHVAWATSLAFLENHLDIKLI